MQETNQHFFEALAKYWQGYASAQEAESPFLRQWSSETLERGMVGRAIAVLDAHIVSQSRYQKTSDEYVRIKNLLYTASYRLWNGLKLFLIGIENLDNYRQTVETLKTIIAKPLNESLVACIMPSSYIDIWQEFVVSTRKQGGFLITLYPIDIDAIARGKLTLFELIEFKLYRQFLLDKPETETQFSETAYNDFKYGVTKKQSWLIDLNSAIDAVGDQPSKWAEHPKLDSLVSILKKKQDCLLIGSSSSGKSILAFQCGQKIKSSGAEVKYIDSGVTSPAIASRALSTLQNFSQQAKEIFLILDDMQSSPSVARYVFTITRLLRVAGSTKNLVALGICWPSYAEHFQNDLLGWTKINILPSEAQRALLAKYKSANKISNIDELSSFAGDDLLIWRLILETPHLQNALNKDAIVDEVWKRKIGTFTGDVNVAKRVILVSALLGRYEIELTEGFLETQTDVTKTSLALMYKSRILRKNGNKVGLGHRSLCNLLADKLSQEESIWSYFRDNNKPYEPIDIIQEYIRSIDANEVWAILKTLRAQVGFKNLDAINQRAQTLAIAWQSIDSLVERIEQQQAVDATWGNTLSSSLFAIEALSSVGKREKSRQGLEFMRSHWKSTETGLEIIKGTSERLDFDQISLRMQEQDKVGLPYEHASVAAQIDFDRFHQTWASGLILCAESAFKEKSQKELEDLALQVEGLQEKNGCFYPSRVPWSTARVLMGLAKCGRTYTNSTCVKKACDWLLRPVSQGGVYQNGIWESGTGSWNSAVETTAMCVIALTLAGIPPRDSRLSPSWNYIYAHKEEWIQPKRELDGVLALSAHVSVTGDWQDVSSEVNYLLNWARGEAFWDSATRSSKETFDQSLKVVFIAATLIDVIWSTLRYSLPIFLDAFAVPQISLDSIRKISLESPKYFIEGENIMIPILFLSADPTDSSRLRLGEELREIQEKLQLAKLRDRFELHQRMSVRSTDVSQSLLDVQPKIVHFSGHGTSEGALCFEDKIGETQPVDPEALASLFEQFSEQVECVLLNACYSDIQANAIARHVKYVIGMTRAIGDQAAIAFAIGFYQALGAGRSIEDAYKLGCVQVRLQGIAEHLTPILIKKLN